jgi:hypothetical protein
MRPSYRTMPNRYVDDSTWFAAGVMATLLYTYVTNRIGRFTISLGRKAHKLNLTLAQPVIGSDCKLEPRVVSPSRPDVTRFFLIVSLNNTGDLAATKLKGNCAITCSESTHNRTLPIFLDTLGNIPYQLEPQEFGGNAITQAIRSGQVWINVDIDLEFFGFDDKAPEKYRAHYEYSHQHHNMIRK